MIRLGDELLQIRRRLSAVTSEDDARRIHQHMNTDKLVRGRDGEWFCCDVVKEVTYQDRDIEDVVEVSQVFDEQGLS